MSSIVVITGASSGFSALTARAPAKTCYTVYAGMRESLGRDVTKVQAAAEFSAEHDVDPRAIGMDVNDQDSNDTAIASVEAERGRIDVLIHNAGHMAVGPTDDFAPKQFTALYDINVFSTQRVNGVARAALDSKRSLALPTASERSSWPARTSRTFVLTPDDPHAGGGIVDATAHLLVSRLSCTDDPQKHTS